MRFNYSCRYPWAILYFCILQVCRQFTMVVFFVLWFLRNYQYFQIDYKCINLRIIWLSLVFIISYWYWSTFKMRVSEIFVFFSIKIKYYNECSQTGELTNRGSTSVGPIFFSAEIQNCSFYSFKYKFNLIIDSLVL